MTPIQYRRMDGQPVLIMAECIIMITPGVNAAEYTDLHLVGGNKVTVAMNFDEVAVQLSMTFAQSDDAGD